MLFLQPAAPGLGIEAGNRDCSEGLGLILKSSSWVGLIRQTKLRREAEKGASECEAPQPQGDISPSGKKHPWGGSRGSALPGGPHPNARGCTHSVGTFSTARASSERGMCCWWRGPGLGLCGRPLPGPRDSTGGVQPRSPRTAPLSPAPPRDRPRCSQAGCPAPRPPPSRTPREGQLLPSL